MIRIGLVGCGHIGTVHAYALQLLADAGLVDARLTAALDADPERARRLTRHHGGAPAVDLDALVDAVDAVWVCTWTSGHLPVVEAAAARGRAVFCEKPLAPDYASSARVAALLEAVPHQVGLVLRRSPLYAAIAEALVAGRYGRPLAAVLRSDQYFPNQGLYGSTWREDAARAGAGTLFEHGIHDVDVLRWLLGDPDDVSARVASRFGYPGIDDTASVTLSFADGTTAMLASIWHQVTCRTSSRRLEVFCEDAMLWTGENDYLGPLHVETRHGVEERVLEPPEWAARLDVPDEVRAGMAQYAAPSRDFLADLAAGRSGHPSAADALAAHGLIDAAYRSAAAGGAPQVPAWPARS